MAGELTATTLLRVTTSLLYGGTDERRQRTLHSSDPLALNWIQTALNRLWEALEALLG